MNEQDFKFYQDILQAQSGIFLSADKVYLLNTRLTPLCKTLGFETLEDYTRHLKTAVDKLALHQMIEAMTTNETSFFRDVKPFQHLKGMILPDLLTRRADMRRLRIWSAACSTGQEAYSVAMTVKDTVPPDSGWHIDIVGTDIADNVLQKATAGVYNNFEIQRGLSMPQIVRHFDQKGQDWAIKDELRRMVKFSRFNLLESPARLGRFDVIFCRNVLIYFNAETKLKVLKALYSALADDGVLLLGSCENVMSDKSGFQPCADMHGVYKKA